MRANANASMKMTSNKEEEGNNRSTGTGRNKLVAWVNRLERINTNLDPATKANATANNERTVTGALSTIASSSSTAAAHTIVSLGGGGLLKPEVEAKNDLCFRSAQLVTELCLMLFAASLLLVAVIVLMSRRVPHFMAHYELVPKLLFFMCLFAAFYSFARWLSLNIYAQFAPTQSRKRTAGKDQE